MAYREPTRLENRLLHALIVGNQRLAIRSLIGLAVEPLDDGGMGSLHLRVSGNIPSAATLRTIASELIFRDADGVDVIASLYVDANHIPIELDIWKVNYTPVISIPEKLPKAKFTHEQDL